MPPTEQCPLGVENKAKIEIAIKELQKKNCKINSYIKWFFVGLAIAGIIWNAAVLHNDVKHIKADIQEIKAIIQK